MFMYYRILIFVIYLLSFPAHAQEKTILILGDSLSAAYGIPVEDGWVSLLEQRLVRQNLEYKVVNASISGETTLGVKTRLEKLLNEYTPKLVVIELGANDGLRGFALSEIEQNLSDIVNAIKQINVDVLLVPMQLPPNYGAAYNQRFMSIYESVSEKQDINLSTFILKDIAQHSDLMQADGLHPVKEAQAMMLDNIWPSLEPLIIK
jgi:acyl-CoA thioesterase I